MTDDETPDEESANADTEPIDPGRPAAGDAPDSAQPPDGASTRPDGSGVSIPSWLAGALVVVLALLIGGAGFAIGRATADDDHDVRPIIGIEGRGGPDRGSRTFPVPGGGRGELPGFPGGPNGRGGDRQGPRAVPGFPGERDRSDDGGEDGSDRRADSDDDSGADSDGSSPPQLPGT